MRKRQRRQRGVAWLLLSAFVLTLLATSLHVHAPVAETSCEACVHHEHPGGHVAQWQGVVMECVLCQLASATFVAPRVMEIAKPQVSQSPNYPISQAVVPQSARGLLPARAPPVVVFS